MRGKGHTTYPLRKFNGKFLGPVKILEVIDLDRDLYRLDMSNISTRIHDIFHVSFLKNYVKFRQLDFPGRKVSKAVPVVGHGTNVFSVERIEKCKIKYGKLQYLVFWKGYKSTDPDARTWECEENIGKVWLLDFWKNNPTEFEYKISENNEPVNATIDLVEEFGILLY